LAVADSITLTGLHGTVAQIRAAGEAAARTLQDDISEWFEVSRTLRGKVHTPSVEYTEWKASQGFDTRPGHRSGMLAESLRFDRLYRINASRGTLVVTFDIELSEVEYATHYSDLYTRGGNLLAITKKAERAFRDDVVSLLPKAKKEKPKAKAKPKPKDPLTVRRQRGLPVTGFGVDLLKQRVRRPSFGSFLIATGASLAGEIAEKFKRVKITRRVA
jgi:hypothetical protein